MPEYKDYRIFVIELDVQYKFFVVAKTITEAMVFLGDGLDGDQNSIRSLNAYPYKEDFLNIKGRLIEIVDNVYGHIPQIICQTDMKNNIVESESELIN